MGLLFPACVSGLLWNDWIGGFIYAGILRIFFVSTPAAAGAPASTGAQHELAIPEKIPSE